MKGLGGWICLTLCLCGMLGAEEVKPVEGSTVKEGGAVKAAKVEHLPGVALSQGITEITGVAISPLLGVSSVGAWRYFHTRVEEREALPWYAQPWAWGTGFGVLALCFLKDSLGTAVPGLLKKPLDMVELFENKVSAAVASGAFVPLVAQEMAAHLRAERVVEAPAGWIGGMAWAPVDAAWLMVPASVVVFLLVWMCSHAINVLIILSPFSTVDAVLKLARAGLLAAVGVAYAIAPWLAVGLCAVIILAAAWMAPAAMRLAIFGTRYALDILLPWRGRRRATPERPHVFTVGRLAGLPPRTGGRLVRLEDGTAAFRYRRWLVDERTIALPAGWRRIESGLLSPSLSHEAGGREARLVLFLPRYRGREVEVAEALGVDEVREHPVVRGFAAVRAWLSGSGRKVANGG